MDCVVSNNRSDVNVPAVIPNWINGHEQTAISKETFPKVNPDNGKHICDVTRSRSADVASAVDAAREAQAGWSDQTPVHRGDLLREIALKLRERQEEVASIVALETGKSFKEALGETGAAIELGLFMAGEGRRFYGRTTTSAVPHRSAMVLRQPVGVAGLIIAANTPIANVAWKVFPALICGNSAILKAAEDTPITAWKFAQFAHEVGLPGGVLNVVQGLGEEAGAALVGHPGVDLISFTGSTEVGRIVQRVAGERLARVCLELGGKNPLIVCEDADLPLAVDWVVKSAFSNAGQRCAAGSRIIVFDEVYDEFRTMLLQRIEKLNVGPGDDDDFGPVINEKQLQNMLASIERAASGGAQVLTGGKRLLDTKHKDGFYLAPTVVESATASDEISRCELFGPVTNLYRVKNFEEALKLANDSDMGLTASIHTRSIHRAMRFIEKIQAGVAVVNGGTYGSEPHMPFGGVKNSGTGWREPGTEALDVYSELKTVYIIHDPERV